MSCVEAGRWHGATAQVRRSRRASMMVRSAQTIPDEDDRQGQVWQRVSRYDMAFGASLLGQRGVLIGLGGQPAFVELFASTSGLRRHLSGLLEASAIDAALLPAEPTPGRRARRFVGRLAMAPIGDELGADAGAGHAMASRSDYHVIRGLGWEDHLLHATVFNRRHPMMEPA
jgi:hypothetical protein